MPRRFNEQREVCGVRVGNVSPSATVSSDAFLLALAEQRRALAAAAPLPLPSGLTPAASLSPLVAPPPLRGYAYDAARDRHFPLRYRGAAHEPIATSPPLAPPRLPHRDSVCHGLRSRESGCGGTGGDRARSTARAVCDSALAKPRDRGVVITFPEPAGSGPLAVSACGTFLCCGVSPGTLSVYKRVGATAWSSKIARRGPGRRPCSDVSVSPQGAAFATLAEGAVCASLTIFPEFDESRITSQPLGGGSDVWAVAWLSRETVLSGTGCNSAAGGGRVKLSQISSTGLRDCATSRGKSADVHALVVTQSVAVAGKRDGSIAIVDIRSADFFSRGDPIAQLPTSIVALRALPSVSPFALLAADAGTTASVIDTRSSRAPLYSLDGYSNRAKRLGVSATAGGLVASVCADATIRVWRAGSSKATLIAERRMGCAGGIALLPSVADRASGGDWCADSVRLSALPELMVSETNGVRCWSA